MKSCDLGDKSVNLYFKRPEKGSFGQVGGLGGLGGFTVQGLAGPGLVHCQSLIQALFFKFLFLPTTYCI